MKECAHEEVIVQHRRCLWNHRRLGGLLDRPAHGRRALLDWPAYGLRRQFPDFAWWSSNVDLPAGLQHRLGGLADEQLFPLWRFLLSIGMATLFVCVAALVVTLLPAWRARKVSQKGTPAEATVVRVEKTGEQVRGRAGVERQLACELDVCPEGGSPYRARTTQFFTDSVRLALQPGRGSSCVTTRPAEAGGHRQPVPTRPSSSEAAPRTSKDHLSRARRRQQA